MCVCVSSLQQAHPLSILDALSSKVHFRGVNSSQLCVWGMKGEEGNMLLRDAPFPYPRIPFSPCHLIGGWRNPRHLSGQSPAGDHSCPEQLWLQRLLSPKQTLGKGHCPPGDRHSWQIPSWAQVLPHEGMQRDCLLSHRLLLPSQPSALRKNKAGDYFPASQPVPQLLL